MTNSSRAYFKLTAGTSAGGLMPDYSTFAGKPTGAGLNANFAFDAWRVAMNVGMDYAWFAADPWQIQYCNGLQAFFSAANATAPYGNQYTVPGGQEARGGSGHSPGLVAMNAVCSLASDQQLAWDFVSELWGTSIPTGKYRYYDGMLFMLGWLHVSGNFRLYGPVPRPPGPAPAPPGPPPGPPPSPPPGPPAPNPPPPGPPPPAPNPHAIVEFKRNGACLVGGERGSAATLGGCYVRSPTGYNLWRTPTSSPGAPLRNVNGDPGLQAVAASCSLGAAFTMAGAGANTVSWNASASRFEVPSCPGSTCAGYSEGQFAVIACDNRGDHGWSMAVVHE